MNEKIRELLLDRNTAELDGAWFDELRLGDNVYTTARLLAKGDALILDMVGMVHIVEGITARLPEHLRDHAVCTLTESGKRERQRIIDEHSAQWEPDGLTLATGLGAGSPIHEMLTQIRDLLAGAHGELIALRCSMMAAAKVAGEGEHFAEVFQEIMRFDAEARKVSER